MVNLRMFSKQKRRELDRKKAAEGAAKHGRTKAEKKAEEAAARTAARHLDGHKRTEP